MDFLNFPKFFFGNIYEKIYECCLVNEHIQEKKVQQQKNLKFNNLNRLFYNQKDFQANKYSLRGCATSRKNYNFQKSEEFFTYRKLCNESKNTAFEYTIPIEKTHKQPIKDYYPNYWLTQKKKSRFKINIFPSDKTQITPSINIQKVVENEIEFEKKNSKSQINGAKYIIPTLNLNFTEKRNSELMTYRENFSESNNKQISPILNNFKDKKLESGRNLQNEWINVNMLLLSAYHDRTIQSTKAKIEMLTFYAVEMCFKKIDSKLHIIEEGSFGRVYKGRYNNCDVAVKVPNLDTMKSDPFGVTERILREWKLLAKINHPNIIGFKGGIILPNKHIWLITEFIQGCDLHSLKYKFKYDIPREKAIKMIKQLIKALDFLHTPTREKGIIIHRDIKPENIIIDNNNWNIYLCDFGDAEEFGSGNKRRLSGATWLYSPIELLNADPIGNHISIQSVSQYNEKWDIWSLGCVLQEFFGNSNPFEYIVDFEDNSNQIYSKLVKAVRENKYIPNIPTNIHPQIRKVIEMCLQPDPRLRPSAKVILKIIDNVF
ncbi:Protein kinase domain protein [Cryptosporidium meleagridis]|uniref:non-specific serine/threonine protein kinase n=1 Tax=Cryptosporidium meleagridis TaxID=93969 RepID=A0A2P4Z5M3_9CRYT|nr:Protein kinase domain protein [Cryptosporidium meleagridis]